LPDPLAPLEQRYDNGRTSLGVELLVPFGVMFGMTCWIAMGIVVPLGASLRQRFGGYVDSNRGMTKGKIKRGQRMPVASRDVEFQGFGCFFGVHGS
jgi:hypothetical protein